jgi:hypothetical protein
MKKYLVIFSLLLLPVFTTPARAVTISPDSLNPTVGTVAEFQLFADPPVNSNAMQLRLRVIGAEIVNYTPPSSAKFLSLPTCGNSLNFTLDSVCVDLAIMNTLIAAGDSLGTVSIRVTNADVLLYKTTNNGYVVSTLDFQTDSGPLVGNATLMPAEPESTPTYIPNPTNVPAPSPVGEAVGTDENPELDINPVVETPWVTYALYGVGALLLLGSIVTVIVLMRKNKSSIMPSTSMPVNSTPVPDSGLPSLPPLPDLPVATTAPNSDLSPLASDPFAASPATAPTSPAPAPENVTPAVVAQPEATNSNGLPPLPQV